MSADNELGFADFADLPAENEEVEQSQPVQEVNDIFGGLNVEESAPEEKAPQQPLIGGVGGLGPAWTRGEIEKPAGEKSMGTYTVNFYTEEQQKRLGVDENGNKVEAGDVEKEVEPEEDQEEPAPSEEEEEDVTFHSIWQEKHRKELADKKAEEQRKKKESRERAQEELNNFYKKRKATISQIQQSNREQQKNFMEKIYAEDWSGVMGILGEDNVVKQKLNPPRERYKNILLHLSKESKEQ